MAAAVSVVIPTRERLSYLDVALSSLREQAGSERAEVLVVEDGPPSPAARELAERHGARYVPVEGGGGLNAARNTGIAHSEGALVAFLDDDVRVCEGWLVALRRAADEHPRTEVFAGRITARLEGPAPRGCGREQPPITTLEQGERDAPTRFAWGANMAIRRSAFERVGLFDVTLGGAGDEQEWQERAGGEALYVAAAAVEHRRTGEDARLQALSRAAYARGRAARRFDARRGVQPSRREELLTLIGCAGHVLRHSCPAGVTMVAHSAGRLREALGRAPVTQRPEADAAATPSFLSGASGTVGGLDGLRRRGLDELAATGELLSGRSLRLAAAARRAPPRRRVLALMVTRADRAPLVEAIAVELAKSRHEVTLRTTPAGDGGKFENLNRLLAETPPAGHDWLLVLDDDVELPHGFLDRLLFLCERFSLTLAQPAHRLHSHAAWEVTRRRPGSVVRETGFVEIGPVTAFAAASFDALLPFPALRMGWGLDMHWAAIARERGWRCGVVDAVPIHHRQAPAAVSYGREEAIAEGESFLRSRPHISAAEAQRTLATHRRW
ncbi:MAG TPA: glycosyltransferase family 2 protein [Solirubrobacteraceae bacterium]|jgi:GT2 family glycosyltransferase|nr:glycosyltransferase family 2 protein [Solirubrobacteraceae bacterium]